MYSYSSNAQARTTQRNGEDGVGNSISGLLQDESAGGDSKSILSSLMDKTRTPMALIQVHMVNIIYYQNLFDS